jgi:hypothetical protein
MKKLALVLALTLTALAGSAFASDWSSDNVGIYFDEAGTLNCGVAAPFTPFPAYMVLTQLTGSDVNAWEIALTYSNVLSLGFVPRGAGAIDVGINPGEHLVGLASPLLVSGGVVVIADLTLMVQNTNPAGISSNGVFFHSLALKVPAYQGTATEIRELHPITAPGSPILSINTGCAVDTENSSFGEVKSLFR